MLFDLQNTVCSNCVPGAHALGLSPDGLFGHDWSLEALVHDGSTHVDSYFGGVAGGDGGHGSVRRRGLVGGK